MSTFLFFYSTFTLSRRLHVLVFFQGRGSRDFHQFFVSSSFRRFEILCNDILYFSFPIGRVHHRISYLCTKLMRVCKRQASHAIFHRTIHACRCKGLHEVHRLCRDKGKEDSCIVHEGVSRVRLACRKFHYLLGIVSEKGNPFRRNGASKYHVNFHLIHLSLTIRFTKKVGRSGTFHHKGRLGSRVRLLLRETTIVSTNRIHFQPTVQFCRFHHFGVNGNTPSGKRIVGFVNCHLYNEYKGHASGVKAVNLRAKHGNLWV